MNCCLVIVLGSEFKLFYSKERREKGGKGKSLTSYLNYVTSCYQRQNMCGIFNDTGYNHEVLLTSTMVNDYSTFGVGVCVLTAKKRKYVNTCLRTPFFSHCLLPLSFIVHSLRFFLKHKQDFVLEFQSLLFRRWELRDFQLFYYIENIICHLRLEMQHIWGEILKEDGCTFSGLSVHVTFLQLIDL